MEFEYPYHLPRTEVRARLEALGEYLGNRHGIRVTWLDESKAAISGKYLVVHIEGTMTIVDALIKVKAKDPGFLWRRKATDYLRGKLGAYLDPDTPLEQLPRGQ